MRDFFLAALLFVPAQALAQQAPRAAQMINLNCVEALVAIGQAKLAGAFSFIPEKDGPAAFADLVVHDKRALKKYAAKLEKDFRTASGLSAWDHEAIAFALSILASPLGETFERPNAKMMDQLSRLSRAPTLSLEEITARRRG